MSKTNSKARNRFEFVAKYKEKDVAFGIKYAGVSANYIFFDENVIARNGTINVNDIPVYETTSSTLDYTLNAKGRSLAVRRDRYLQSGVFRGDGADDLVLIWDESLLDVNHDSWTSPYAGMISIPAIQVQMDGKLHFSTEVFSAQAAQLKCDYSEITIEGNPRVTDARPKMIKDFTATLRLLVLGLRFTKLTTETLSIVNQANLDQLINILFAAAQKFYKDAVTSGKMFTFPSAKTGENYVLPYKVVNQETGESSVINKDMQPIYSISMKDLLTYLTPMLKHACGAYNGSAAIFSIPGSSTESKNSYEGLTSGIRSNIPNLATRTSFTTDDNTKAWILTVAGDVIIANTTIMSAVNVGPAVSVKLISNSYIEIKCYRPSIVMINRAVNYALFNNKYDSPVLIATKHTLRGRKFTFSGQNLIRLVDGGIVDIDNYEFQLNDLVKVKLDHIADSYYRSNEILNVRTNGSLLDIVDQNYFPIAAGDFSSVAVDLEVTRNNGVISSISVTFDQDVYVNSLQVPFNSIYSFDAANNKLFVDTSTCGALTDLINGSISYDSISVKLFNYATQFARPTFDVTTTLDTYTERLVMKTNFNVSAAINWSDITLAANDLADSAGCGPDAEIHATWIGDHMNILYYFTCPTGTYGFSYNVDQGSNVNSNTPTAYYQLDVANHIFKGVGKSALESAVSALTEPVSLHASYVYDSGMWSDAGTNIIEHMKSLRNESAMAGYMVGNAYTATWWTDGFTPSNEPSFGYETVHDRTSTSQSATAEVNDLGEILAAGQLTMNLIPLSRTVDSISIAKSDDDLCIGTHFSSNYFTIGFTRENIEGGYVIRNTNWSLTIRNELTQAPVRTLFSEEDVQYISTHCMNVFMRRTNIAEIIASYVSPNLSEVSPTLLADAQTFLQSSMRDSIEATLMSIEDVMLNEENVISVDELTEDDDNRLVYYINKLGQVGKGVLSDVKGDIQDGSDVIDAEVVNSHDHLISVPRMNSEGQLVFDAPCSLEDIPTTINDGESELPLLQAILKSKLSCHEDELNPTETEIVDQNLSDYVTNLIDVYGDYTATIIESDMAGVVDQIAESNPDIALGDATTIIASKADQVKAKINTDPVVVDAIDKSKTISSRLQAKIAESADKAKVSTIAVVTDAYAKFGKISNGVSTKVSAWASKLYSVANDIGQSVIKMFGTDTEITRDNWNGSGNVTNRSNLSLAFDINFPDLNVVSAAKAAVGVVNTVAGKIYDKCANFVKKTFKDGVSFKINEAGYETLDCPAYCEVMTLSDFKANYGSLATYIDAYRQQSELENITFVTQMNTEIIFIQLHADNSVKIICNPLVDIEDTNDVQVESDLDFLDRMLAAIERATDDYNFVADQLNMLFATLNSVFRNLVNSSDSFNHINFDRTNQYNAVFAGAKISTKEKQAKGWKILGWVTAAVGAVLCCTGIAAGAGAALIGAGAALGATGHALEASGQSAELQQIIKRAREETAFANAEISSAELLGVWNSCPVEIGQLYLFCLPILFEGGFVHPGNGKLLKDGRYVPCAIFAGFPALKYSLVTDDERAKQTRRGLLTIAAVVIGTIVASRLATRKIRAKKKYKKICAEQWALENPSRDSKFDAKGKRNKWWKEDPKHPGDEKYFTFDQNAFNKAKSQYFKNQEKLAWKSNRLSSVLGGSGGLPQPLYDSGADFDELSTVIGYKRSTKK